MNEVVPVILSLSSSLAFPISSRVSHPVSLAPLGCLHFSILEDLIDNDEVRVVHTERVWGRERGPRTRVIIARRALPPARAQEEAFRIHRK
eukprot:scaffold38271_cov29-Tisochrysis_lutea.AAC.5